MILKKREGKLKVIERNRNDELLIFFSPIFTSSTGPLLVVDLSYAFLPLACSMMGALMGCPKNA